MLHYIPYILLFALATAVIYGWGLESPEKRPCVQKRSGAGSERADSAPAFQQRADQRDRTRKIP